MIQGNLEYLMSSLPHLSFSDVVEVRKRVYSLLRKYAGPVHEEDDLINILDAEAEKFLTPGSQQLFASIELENMHTRDYRQSDNPVVSSYASWMHALKEDIAALRIARRNKGKTSSQKKRALPIDEGSPLEEEVQLLKMQWDKAEELSVGHHADLGALITYKLKLMVLLRWWSFDADKGFEMFNTLTKAS